jgi:uncharacterized membrane protein SirB2
VIEFYPQIRAVHIGAVGISGALFALRGAGALLGARWPLAAWLRWTSMAIDTVLLSAALMLVTILPAALFASGWLHAKLALLVLYVVLGSSALRRARSVRVRGLCFGAALAVFVGIVAIARTHQPFGGWVLR